MQLPLDTLRNPSFRQEGQVSKAAEYRTNAEICRRMADKAQNEEDRRAWLEMAQSWSFLTKLDDVVPPERSGAAEYETSPLSDAGEEWPASVPRAVLEIVRRPKSSIDSASTVVSRMPRVFVRVGSGLRTRLSSAYTSISRLLK
jgi:hypothetical protein